MPEVSVDPMKVVQDAVLEFTDKKDLFLAYMSSMLVGGPGKDTITSLTQLWKLKKHVLVSGTKQ